ncbi:hypothetical protein EGR_09421 [Echinococcus granulosus]|uniref:Uncharacterized protein n=1 Tax=Echinococcus granulosus TaxID=6210 RepID=W6U3N2_ECHGR|nr:hypothetical protein EGR_09421 [Echinococcus granulosus]EUB55708.1 hypothetical protein EGR_09421 [Echinococcus granulosus]
MTINLSALSLRHYPTALFVRLHLKWSLAVVRPFSPLKGNTHQTTGRVCTAGEFYLSGQREISQHQSTYNYDNHKMHE